MDLTAILASLKNRAENAGEVAILRGLTRASGIKSSRARAGSADYRKMNSECRHGCGRAVVRLRGNAAASGAYGILMVRGPVGLREIVVVEDLAVDLPLPIPTIRPL